MTETELKHINMYSAVIAVAIFVVALAWSLLTS